MLLVCVFDFTVAFAVALLFAFSLALALPACFCIACLFLLCLLARLVSLPTLLTLLYSACSALSPFLAARFGQLAWLCSGCSACSAGLANLPDARSLGWLAQGSPCLILPSPASLSPSHPSALLPLVPLLSLLLSSTFCFSRYSRPLALLELLLFALAPFSLSLALALTPCPSPSSLASCLTAPLAAHLLSFVSCLFSGLWPLQIAFLQSYKSPKPRARNQEPIERLSQSRSPEPRPKLRIQVQSSRARQGRVRVRFEG